MKQGQFYISSFSVLIIFICLSLAGVALMPLIPVKLVPSQTLPGMTVSFTMRGQSARVVESEVTSRLEALLVRVKGVRKISSSSAKGSGKVTLEFDRHTDLQMARFEVATLIRQVWNELPEEVSYPQVGVRYSDKDATRPCLTYTLNALVSPLEIQQYAEEHVKPKLAGVKGVSRVVISGANPMEWQLFYDSEQLQALGLTPADLQEAILDYYRRTTLDACQVVPEGDPAVFSPEAISVRTAQGRWISLASLLRVKHAESAPQQYYRINGLNAVYLSVTADESANQLQVGREVKRLMAEMGTHLPQGYETHISYDATERIVGELNTVGERVALTLLILLLFVAVVSRSLRYLWLIVCGLSVNLATAFIFYYFCGLEIQIYSLAGITVSLSLMVDNLIMMADHYGRERGRAIFLPMLAATLTSIGALAVVFMLDEKTRLNLLDFAVVIIFNLLLSLFVALFFVPAFMDCCGMGFLGKRRPLRGQRLWCRPIWLNPHRWTVLFNRAYGWLIVRVLRRFRIVICLVMLLVFGLPVFLMPVRLDDDTLWAGFYNRVFGSDFYKESVRPVTDVILGGTLRLFVQKVYPGSYFSSADEPVLTVGATLPTGSTLEQMNELVKQMEAYLSRQTEIRLFETSVGVGRASIRIYFRPEHQYDGYPYILKGQLVRHALQLGGGSWSVYGLEDIGFNNDVRERSGSYRVQMFGYNYDELCYLAEAFRQKLLTHKRIKEVDINSDFQTWKDDYEDFYLQMDQRRMARLGLTPAGLLSTLSPTFGRNLSCGQIWTGSSYENLSLRALQAETVDVWGALHRPFSVSGRSFKISDMGGLVKMQAPWRIVKEGQQYRLCLQYEYIGAAQQGERVLLEDLAEFREHLPMGYTVDIANRGGRRAAGGQYGLLLFVIGVIFLITSILFDSFRQPLLILLVIPPAFVGVFLTFYGFELNFDNGGYASFILLCGITVNASIYLLKEYCELRRRFPTLSWERVYLKAWNHKIIPILLTVVSTVLGFIPFLTGGEREGFWFPLAAGTIGGLIASLSGIFLLLPMFLKKR